MYEAANQARWFTKSHHVLVGLVSSRIARTSRSLTITMQKSGRSESELSVIYPQ